ncbi:hypothetical protein [Stutzerimonas urumqiensis]|uniref:hypothetical protein n=1 Tax=Stutzerimonas urumqiensis TaxID=638269 RepID=UPI001C499B15|nr:hypothetical protein [Stutzerimonas urumqiensis]
MAEVSEGSGRPLMKRYELMGSHDLTDELYAIAYSIEQTLLNAGAVSGRDYTYLDLMKLAQPFVLELFKIDGRLSYEYPANKVCGPRG